MVIRYYSILFVVNTLIGILLFIKGGSTGIQPKLFFYIAGISLGLGIAFPFLLGLMDFYQVVMIFIVLISAVAFKIASKADAVPGELPELQYSPPAVDEPADAGEIPEEPVEEPLEEPVSALDEVQAPDALNEDADEDIDDFADLEEEEATDVEQYIAGNVPETSEEPESDTLTLDRAAIEEIMSQIEEPEFILETEQREDEAVLPEITEDTAAETFEAPIPEELPVDEALAALDDEELLEDSLEEISIPDIIEDIPLELPPESFTEDAEFILETEQREDEAVLPEITEDTAAETFEAPVLEELPADEALAALDDEPGKIVIEEHLEEPIEELHEDSLEEISIPDIIEDIPLESPPESFAEEADIIEGPPLNDEIENIKAISFVEAPVEEAAAALLDTDIGEFEPLSEPVFVALELSDFDFTDNNLEAVIDKGFAAKFEGQHEQAIQLFKAALRMQPDVDLVQLLALDISGMYIETGNYQQAWICMENLLQDYEGYINSDLRKEIFTQMKYLEILQNLLQKADLPPLPLAEVPDLIKFTAEEKTRRWKEEVFSPKHSF